MSASAINDLSETSVDNDSVATNISLGNIVSQTTEDVNGEQHSLNKDMSEYSHDEDTYTIDTRRANLVTDLGLLKI